MGAGHHALGKISFEKLKDMSENAIRSPGVCSGMGTANSMHSVCEALGMALPGSAPVAANSDKMFEDARRAGERIVGMVWEDLTPRKILTAGAFSNAAAVGLGISGSINCIKHLQAIAIEAEVDVDAYALYDTLGAKIPVLSAVRPNGEESIEAFEAAGGARAVMKRLEPFLDAAAMTATGKTVAENLADFTVGDDEVIRPLDRAFSNEAPIVILKGSLAPDGAIVKVGLRGEGRVLSFTGPARVFDVPAEAEEAVRGGTLVPGEVVILRGIGVIGGPGMGGASRLVFAIDGTGIGAKVAVVTDGQLSGLVNKGLVVGEVTPEAAVGGPLGLVENGDTISIDVDKKTIELHVPATEMAERRARFRNRPPTTDSGWLSIYERTVQPLKRGATMFDRGRGK